MAVAYVFDAYDDDAEHLIDAPETRNKVLLSLIESLAYLEREAHIAGLEEAAHHIGCATMTLRDQLYQ